MESILYIKIRRPNNLLKECPVNALATCWELFFALLATLICMSYAVHHDPRFLSLPVSAQSVSIGFFDFLRDPSPSLMLVSCIVLGCSVSSFAYRHQQHDRFQPLIFVTAIMIAAVFGFAARVDANLVMLALIPTALCLSMMASVTFHWGLKCLENRKRTTRIEIRCCELGEGKGERDLRTEKEMLG